jgi:hypothetical protein
MITRVRQFKYFFLNICIHFVEILIRISSINNYLSFYLAENNNIKNLIPVVFNTKKWEMRRQSDQVAQL